MILGEGGHDLMFSYNSRFYSFLAAGLLFLQPASAITQDAQVIVLTDGPIPKNYETWSVFLICSPTWLLPEQENQLLSLYEDFEIFGNFIGDDHLAVWFSTTSQITPEGLAATLDYQRNFEFCSKFDLEANDTPHVLVTNSYDVLVSAVEEVDSAVLTEDDVKRVDVVSFHGLPPRKVHDAFNLLTNIVREQRSVLVVSDEGSFWRAFQSFVEATANAVLALSDDISVTVDMKFVKVTVD